MSQTVAPIYYTTPIGANWSFRYYTTMGFSHCSSSAEWSDFCALEALLLRTAGNPAALQPYE
jgi:hypothetical protein